MSSESDIDEESNCPICLDDDYDVLCELDCYLYRNDNVKHFMCNKCVTKLFKSSRWYQRAKCPFCRHTIHRQAIVNQNMYEQWSNAYREFVNTGYPLWQRACFNLSVFAIICYYFNLLWIAFVCIAIICVLILTNTDNELISGIIDNIEREWRIIYHEITVRQRARRPLQHVGNKKKRENRKGSHIRRVRKRDKHRNKVKNRLLGVNKGYQKHNKRYHSYQNRNYR